MKEKFCWNSEKELELKQKWNNVPLYVLATELHASTETIEEKAKALGLPAYKSNRWTKEEEALLIEYSKKYVTKTIAKKLNRSYLAVQKKAVKLGVELRSTRDPWKKWMIEYLKDNINKLPVSKICEMLDLTYYQVVKKCEELGIEYIREGWTKEEVETLKKYAQTCHYTELTKVLPGRSVGAIGAKAFELGIETISLYKKLNNNEIKYIKDNWGIKTVAQIAKDLKTSTSVIYRYKRELNLPNVGQKKKWTDEVINKIRKDAKTKTREELAKKYKTSSAQISRIAAKNNIKLIDTKKIWTDELEEELKKLVTEGKNLREISVLMQMKVSSIRDKSKDLGLFEKTSKNDSSKWSRDDIKILEVLAPQKTTFEIADILNKTETQVYRKALKQGIEVDRGKKHLWTEQDTKDLIRLASKYEMHIIAQVMERAESTIRVKAKELGLKLKFKQMQPWSVSEEKMLMEYAKQYTAKEISYLLDRTEASVRGKLLYLGISAKRSPFFWTKEEERKLIILSKDFDMPEIAVKLDKTYEQVSLKLYSLGLKAKNYSNKPWTEEESMLLLELLEMYSTFEVAEMLDRSEEAIRVKAIKFGYDVDNKHRRWTKEDEVLLSDLWGTEPMEKIAKKLNRTVSAIINRVYILGLGSQISNNYEGLTIQQISDILQVNTATIWNLWVMLGLKLKVRKISDNRTYSYVEINDLYDFLEKNQNIWDSRNLEKNMLGIEPEWLIEKRKKDQRLPADQILSIKSLTKQQLLLTKQYFLDLESFQSQVTNNKGPVLVKK